MSDNKRDFYKNFLIMLKGSVLAKIIPIAIMPLLTRIYEAEAFGKLALYLSIISILTVISTGRYERAILIPKQLKASYSLAALSIVLSAMTMGLLLVIIAAAVYVGLGSDLYSQFGIYLYFIPLLAFLSAFQRSVTSLLNRLKMYQFITFTVIFLSTIQVASKIALSFVDIHTGLIAATVLANLFLILYVSYALKISRFFKHQTIKTLWNSFRQYLNQPRYLLLADTVNAISIQLPLILTSYLFDLKTVGFLSLAISITSLPASFISNSISSVFRQQALSDFNKNGHFDQLYRDVVKKLAPLILIFFIGVFLFSDIVFVFAFGGDWIKSAEFSKYIVFMTCFQFVARITGHSFLLLGRQKEFMNFQLLMFFSSSLGYLAGYYIWGSFLASLAILVFVNSALYLYLVVRGYTLSKGG